MLLYVRQGCAITPDGQQRTVERSIYGRKVRGSNPPTGPTLNFSRKKTFYFLCFSVFRAEVELNNPQISWVLVASLLVACHVTLEYLVGLCCFSRCYCGAAVVSSLLWFSRETTPRNCINMFRICLRYYPYLVLFNTAICGYIFIFCARFVAPKRWLSCHV